MGKKGEDIEVFGFCFIESVLTGAKGWLRLAG